jgi:hypothetical protein
VDYFGYRRHQKTKLALERFIDDPRAHLYTCANLGEMIHRITWVGDDFKLVCRQDCGFDAQWIVDVIRGKA